MNKKDVLIIGAGPTGLFCAHQLGIIGLSCEIVDNLDKAGGQCIELYPDKPIYDIPAVPECTGEELTKNLLKSVLNASCQTVLLIHYSTGYQFQALNLCPVPMVRNDRLILNKGSAN